ncbi:MAG: lipoprotein [Gammaproteobacteria bacterium]|nr:lipoprotein [Gammaproteobacteria bacterium]
MKTLVILAVIVLSSCGRQGDLYLPPDEDTNKPAPQTSN